MANFGISGIAYGQLRRSCTAVRPGIKGDTGNNKGTKDRRQTPFLFGRRRTDPGHNGIVQNHAAFEQAERFPGRPLEKDGCDTTTQNQRRLAAAARNRQICGLLNYVLSGYRREDCMELFMRAFEDELHMEYAPAARTPLLGRAVEINILSLVDPPCTVAEADQRRAII